MAQWTWPGPSWWGRSRRHTAGRGAPLRVTRAGGAGGFSSPRRGLAQPHHCRCRWDFSGRPVRHLGVLTRKPEEMLMKKTFVRGTWHKSRAFSPAVVTQGGKIIWIAGHTGQKDAAGKSLAGDFDAQVHQTFKNIESTLSEVCGTLKDVVTITVFLADSRFTTRMTEIRTEILGEDFPASAAITGTGFGDPAMLIEIQGIAVVGDQ